LFNFRFDPAYLANAKYPTKTLQWTAGIHTSPAVWVGIFLLIVLFINLLPVRQYGRIEYIAGCIKITFLVGLIVFNTIINGRRRHHEDRFWTYETPLGFASQNMTLSETKVLTGSVGKFASTWTAMTTVVFSLIGFEMIFITAAENKDLRQTETIKLASRKIAMRSILLYTLATFTVGLNVPYNDSNLKDITIHGVDAGQNSVFIIATVLEGVKFLPHLINGFYIFSATSTAINMVFGASRILHALASTREAWPEWGPIEAIRARLERTRHGVPMNAVFVSWLIGFLAFLSTKAAQAEVRLISNITTHPLIRRRILAVYPRQQQLLS
jgi:amino acid transporter